MLYRLSYASRCKLTIILIGRQIARKTAKNFSAAETLAFRDFPPANIPPCLSPSKTLCLLIVTGIGTQVHGLRIRANRDTNARQENDPSAPPFTDTLTIRTMCVGLRLLVQVFHRVYRGIVDNHFVVQMWTRRLAGHSHGANNLSAFYFLAHDDKNLAEMPVLGRHPKSVIHHNRVTVTGIPPRLQDDAITASLNSRAVRGAKYPLRNGRRLPH